jgi:hypothetical protein
MPFLAPFAVPLISGVASGIGGALANRKKTSTSTSTSTPTWGPEFSGLQTDAIDALRKRLADPTAGIDPLRYNALDQVNAGYSGLPNRVGTQLAKRGMGQSGKMGAALKGIDISRMRDLSTTGAAYDKMGLDQQDRTMQMIEQMLSLGRGTSSTGTSTDPGNMLGGGVGAGLETFTTMLMLDKMLKGGSGGSSGFTGSWSSPDSSYLG